MMERWFFCNIGQSNCAGKERPEIVAFHVSLVGRSDLSGEIYHQIRPAILEGRLKPGERLSPTRELATALTVSRSTVTAAYENLLAARIAEGLSRLRRCFDERLPPRLKAA
jgi:DNA-binding transcriptional MocR family regulator